MLLTVAQIRRLLVELEYETIFNDNATIRLQKRKPGYANDYEVEKIQRNLSIMLEAAAKDEMRT